jgi:hypothetical protein
MIIFKAAFSALFTFHHNGFQIINPEQMIRFLLKVFDLKEKVGGQARILFILKGYFLFYLQYITKTHSVSIQKQPIPNFPCL